MADSNITKRALATALKQLMEEEPFEKIQVSQICERCGMNRKSFYYHFKDKYDLLNWIFDVEIISYAQEYTEAAQLSEQIEYVQDICNYLYENRSFYRKALQVEGQNSFKEHFTELCVPVMKLRLTELLGDEEVDDFTVDFFADAFTLAIERWLTAPDCMPPEEFVSRAVKLIFNGAKVLDKEANELK